MSSYRLLADSGSTKTDWLLFDGKNSIKIFTTSGVNPFLMDFPQIETLIRLEVLPQSDLSGVREIEFYGAGCRGRGIERIRTALNAVWPKAERIEVASDLLGAARVLFPKTDGIACILGTGSNSGLYLDGKIVQNTPPLGFILGDEGSGAALGKRLIGDVLKGQLPDSIGEAFRTTYPDLSPNEIIERTYRAPLPNRFLASFAPFIYKHKEQPEIKRLLIDEFSRFFIRNIKPYHRADLNICFVGSIAYYFKLEISTAAKPFHYNIGRILKRPFDAITLRLGHLTNGTD